MSIFNTIAQFIIHTGLNFFVIYWLTTELLQGIPNIGFWNYLRKEQDIDMLKKELLTSMASSNYSNIIYFSANTDLKVTYLTKTNSIIFPYAIADYSNKKIGILRYSKAYTIIKYQYGYLRKQKEKK